MRFRASSLSMTSNNSAAKFSAAKSISIGKRRENKKSREPSREKVEIFSLRFYFVASDRIMLQLIEHDEIAGARSIIELSVG